MTVIINDITLNEDNEIKLWNILSAYCDITDDEQAREILQCLGSSELSVEYYDSDDEDDDEDENNDDSPDEEGENEDLEE